MQTFCTLFCTFSGELKRCNCACSDLSEVQHSLQCLEFTPFASDAMWGVSNCWNIFLRELFLIVYLFLMQVVMLNLLIAMMTRTFDNLDARLDWILVTQRIRQCYILQIETVWQLPPLNVLYMLLQAIFFILPSNVSSYSWLGKRALTKTEISLSARYGTRRSLYLMPELAPTARDASNRRLKRLHHTRVERQGYSYKKIISGVDQPKLQRLTNYYMDAVLEWSKTSEDIDVLEWSMAPKTSTSRLGELLRYIKAELTSKNGHNKNSKVNLSLTSRV
eukprot:SAG11_NODE_412_length_9695_cov_5.948729_3_plen_277_part_00